MFKPDENRFLINKHGKLHSTFVDNFVAAEMGFAKTSVICFRLWDRTEPQTGTIPIERAYQFRISSNRARKLATALTEIADEIDGVGKPLQ